MADAYVDGLQGIFAKLDKISGNVPGAMKDGLDIGLQETVDHIKVEFSRPSTGKGFTDQTGNLRNSLGHDSQMQYGGVLGVVNAGMPYAPDVEIRNEGRHAYLWPGVNEMSGQIVKRIADSVKAILK